MKRKILFSIIALMLFISVISSIIPVLGVEWVWHDNNLGLTGRPWQTRGFYSNYTGLFYSFWEDNVAGITYYSFSYDAETWIGRYIVPLGGVSETPELSNGFDVWLEPNGRYVDFAWVNTVENPNHLHYERLELGVYGNISTTEGVQEVITALFDGTKEPVSDVSITRTSDGRPVIAFTAESGGGAIMGYLLRCGQTDGTWTSHSTANADTVFGNQEDIDRQNKVIALENGGVRWIHQYTQLAGAMRTVVSGVNFYDGAGWTVHGPTGLNDDEGGDWADHQWSVGGYGNRTILFKQQESNPDGQIQLDYMISDGTADWENLTRVSFQVAGDAGATEFMPLVAMDENYSAVFIWGIEGNETLWYRMLYPNGTLETDYTEWQDCGFNLVENQWGSFGTLWTASPMVVELLENGSPDFIQYDYLWGLGGGSILGQPVNHLNTTLYNQDGTVNDGWIFEGEVYDLESYIDNATSFYVNTSDSRHQIEFHWNNASEQMSISVDPGDQFTIGLAHSEFERFGNITRLLWRFIPARSIIDCVNQSWGYRITNDDIGLIFNGTLGFTTSIYNLGGLTYYTFNGDGARVTGGHPFELQATNGTDGSNARAEQIYRKLQHVHLLIEIEMDNEWDVGNGEFDIDAGVGFVDIGIDYRLNNTWIEGFSVRLYVQDADVGHHNAGNDHNWVEWSVDWYNYDPGTGTQQNLRSGLIYSNHWGYDNENLTPDYHNRTSSQLWVDLWFDRTNASTTVSGQVNAMFHGMREHGSSWWFGYGAFQPMISDYGNAMMLDDLYDEGGNVTDSMKYDLMRFFVEVGKVADADGDDETWTIRAIENFNRKHADDRMQGIEQPAFEETLVLDMPMFQSNNPLIRAIDGLSRSIWIGALGFIKILWGAMDSIFEWAGFGPGFFSLLTSYMMEIPSLVIVIMDNLAVLMVSLVDIIEGVAQVLVLILPAYVGSFGLLTTAMIRYWNYFMDLMGGGMGIDFSILQDIAIQEWVNFGLWMLPFWEIWNIIWAKDVTGRLKDRVEFYSKIFNGMLNFLKGMVDLMGNLVQAIRSFLPI